MTCVGSVMNPAVFLLLWLNVQELEKYRRFLPTMRYLRGDNFLENDHWPNLFTMLGLSEDVRDLQKLTVGHFLDRRDQVVHCREAIKELYARAQGEVSLLFLLAR